MKFKKLNFAIFSLIALGVTICLIPSVSANVSSEIVFSNFKAADGTQYTNSLSVGTMRDSNELQSIVTREGKISSTDTLQPIELTRRSFIDGNFNYTAERISSNTTAVMPVLYAEENIVATQYSLEHNYNNGFSQPLYDVVSSNITSFSDNTYSFSLYSTNNVKMDRDFVVVRSDVSSTEAFPYNCTLEVNGRTYSPATRDSYFDNETGNITRVYMTFYDLTEADVLGNAKIHVNSIMKKYTATEYSIS